MNWDVSSASEGSRPGPGRGVPCPVSKGHLEDRALFAQDLLEAGAAGGGLCVLWGGSFCHLEGATQ